MINTKWKVGAADGDAGTPSTATWGDALALGPDTAVSGKVKIAQLVGVCLVGVGVGWVAKGAMTPAAA